MQWCWDVLSVEVGWAGLSALCGVVLTVWVVVLVGTVVLFRRGSSSGRRRCSRTAGGRVSEEKVGTGNR